MLPSLLCLYLHALNNTNPYLSSLIFIPQPHSFHLLIFLVVVVEGEGFPVHGGHAYLVCTYYMLIANKMSPDIPKCPGGGGGGVGDKSLHYIRL